MTESARPDKGTGSQVSAAPTLYGVMHENSGGWSVIRYRDRDEAESRLYECRDDGAECYLVRARIEWVTVPDGE